MKHRNSRSGFTLIELVIVGSVLSFLAMALVESSVTMSRVTSSGNTQTVLQLEAEEAMRTMVRELKRTGFKVVNGKQFPHIMNNGVTAGADFVIHDHAMPNQEAVAGDLDFGQFSELIFVLPSDMDGNGRPDMDVDQNGIPELDGNRDGQLSESAADTVVWDAARNEVDPDTNVFWSTDEISYVVVTAADGRNYLERRVNGARARQIARDVERIEFDVADTDPGNVPLSAVRVRLFFRKRDSSGALYQHAAEVTVKMRNGELE